MYPELYQYLLQHKQLPVPGIGIFSLERTPAAVDFPNKIVQAPVYAFALKPFEIAPSKKLYCWLSSLLHISERDAVVRFNDFAFDLKKRVEAGDTITWNGVGTIRKDLGGGVRFTAEQAISMKPVAAVKVLRQKAEHTIRVGEEEKTSTQMTEMLTQPAEKRSWWWTWALGIAVLAIVFIGWYLSQHGMDAAATANQKKTTPTETISTYRQLP